MNPFLLVALRRSWRVIGAITAFVIFTVIHFAFFRPAAARYRTALASVGGIEAVFNPGGNRPGLPPRVFSLITDSSLNPQDAVDRGSSGALGVILLEDLGRIAAHSGLAITSSDPGTVSQEPLMTQVRAHLVLRGHYGELVAFFDEMSRSQSLLTIERFEIKPGADGLDVLEIWAVRLYLKQQGSRP